MDSTAAAAASTWVAEVAASAPWAGGMRMGGGGFHPGGGFHAGSIRMGGGVPGGFRAGSMRGFSARSFGARSFSNPAMAHRTFGDVGHGFTGQNAGVRALGHQNAQFGANRAFVGRAAASARARL